jgi:hypothetical protein
MEARQVPVADIRKELAKQGAYLQRQ